ncbi:MAG: acyl carrier protein, partial [Gammaproteobacteria bacterium]
MSSNPAPRLDASIDQDEVLRLVVQLGRESNPGLAERPAAGLDGELERDHGLDSLARMELLARLERHFGVVLGEREMAEARTPLDLCSVLAAAAAAGRTLAPGTGR